MKILTIALFAVAIAVVAITLSAQPRQPEVRQLFEQWKDQYAPLISSNPQQDQYRFLVFQENLKIINEHNSKLGKSYTMGINQFTALTQTEFIQTYLSSFTPLKQNLYNPLIDQNKPSVQLNVDWNASGAVRPVMNQGQCAAGYAFSTTGGVQGLAAISYKTQLQFSPQQIVDCTQSYGNSGCQGGYMTNSYKFVKDLGLNTLSAYPYTGVQGNCKSSSGLFKIYSYASVTSCSDLENKLIGKPISVSVDATNFSKYKYGAFDDCQTNVNYGALLIGATDATYKIKLSWGTSFGEDGTMRLIRQANICGICSQASYPIAQ